MDDRSIIERLESLAAGLAAPEELLRLLPDLAARLERLALLESEFSHAVETAKLEAMRQLAYGASHEINNPLANISARAQTLLQDERDPERRRRLAAINSQAFRAHEMIADMMLFARPPRPAPEDVELAALADDVIRRLAEEAAAQQTELVRVGPAEPLVARVDPTQIRVALRALLTNSLESLGDGGRIEVSVGPGASPGAAQIVVSDNGPGIRPEDRPHIFDPFYSGREAGRGLGFGLSKCWRIVTAHGGRIDALDSPQGGASFRITLPGKGIEGSKRNAEHRH